MARQPDPWRGIRAEFEELKALVKRLISNIFTGTGFHPNGLGGMDSDNYVPNVSGFRLAETPEFNDLKLRGGIIGNAALTNPVVGDAKATSATGFALAASTLNELAGVNLTVP